MEFTNRFTVAAPLQQVWSVVTDPQQVTPCVPGAQITEVIDEQHFKGTVKVKLGAVQMQYRGEMEMLADEGTRSILLRGKGTDARGGGGASGTVSVELEEDGDGTQVVITAQVDITGRVAQFGRGIIQDVSNRLIREFARCLEAKVSYSEGDQAPATGAATTQAPDAAGAPAPSPAPSSATAPPAPGSPGGSRGGAAVPSAGSAGPAAPAPPAPPQPTTAVTHSGPSQSGGELQVGKIIADIARERIAAGLRYLARLIEPK